MSWMSVCAQFCPLFQVGIQEEGAGILFLGDFLRTGNGAGFGSTYTSSGGMKVHSQLLRID
jgi:hypothetical protein